ncbi:MAG: hypothetical protein FLDDKLPJ_01871 [Phycisphaerae bacterium]|nr:hypothetical protein [Phycisphaerae bacterium]
MQPIHETFDVDVWKRRFPLDRLRAEARAFVENRAREDPRDAASPDAIERHVRLMSPGGTHITSPGHLAEILQLQEEIAQRACPMGEGTPADIFVWGLGEPSHPAGTKIGGVPYWPAKEPWPTDDAGNAMTFLAQICFADSRDIVGYLPGDVLLLFVPGSVGGSCDIDGDPDGSPVRWYWQPLDPSDRVQSGGPVSPLDSGSEVRYMFGLTLSRGPKPVFEAGGSR